MTADMIEMVGEEEEGALMEVVEAVVGVDEEGQGIMQVEVLPVE